MTGPHERAEVPEQHRVDARPGVDDVARHLVPAQSPPSDAYLLPAVHALVDGAMKVARQFGPLPPVRSDAFLDAEPAQQIAVLLVIAEAWLIGDPHRVIRSMLKQASDDVHGGESRRWHDWAVNHVPHTELQRRRAVPGHTALRDVS